MDWPLYISFELLHALPPVYMDSPLPPKYSSSSIQNYTGSDNLL